ncbi:caffeoyl-CoA O-methyltransferase-like [Mercurialis annua]|uniref:caffeoyl-CoA O-methyltransferase-like n=1 Tax=Mercurialis annua TaxID=3986 RepID=UPI00215ECD64|nr:caffeoyl-CoA O-methyltransferase-like [Mercurialis annua]
MDQLPTNGILQSDALKEYIYKTSVYPREHGELKNIREATVTKYGHSSVMAVPVDEGLFLTMLMKIMNPKKTLEIGVFTGYSLLATALGLPDDAQVTAIDPNQEAYEVGLPFIRNAGVDHKINFIKSDAKLVLTEMLDNNKGVEEIDFAFVDAEKHKYKEYHEQLLKLVKVGGIIAYDNTLFFGFVAQPPNYAEENLKRAINGVLELNEFLANDSRIEISQISIGDGLTLCRRLK